MTIALLGAPLLLASAGCTPRALNEESADLLRRAQPLPAVSQQQMAKVLVDSLESAEILAGLRKDAQIRLPNGGQILLRKNCNLAVRISLEGLLRISTSGEMCKGFEITHGITFPVQIREMTWDLLEARLSFRTHPEWSNGLANAVTPLINLWLKPRLPKEITQLKQDFALRKPEASLQILAPLLGSQPETSLRDTLRMLQDVSLRFTNRPERNTKVKLMEGEFLITKGSSIEVQINFKGPFAVALIHSVRITLKSPEPKFVRYELLMGTMLTPPEPWDYVWTGKRFELKGEKKKKTLANTMIQQETPALLAAVRTFLKQAQPGFPALIPDGILDGL